jgi:hypothetical protein
MFYTIYKITNTINGKFYIGKHKTKDLDDGYMGSGKILKHAISKYGLDNFHKEILHICKDEAHMDLLESILVVPDAETNYNLCEGGKGGWSFINAQPEIRQKRREHGKLRPLEHFKRMGKANANHTSQRMKTLHAEGKIRYDTWKGKKHTDEQKQKLSAVMKEKQKGSKNSQYGTCWITNGRENKKIKRQDLNAWIEQGYRQGRI